MVCYSNAPVWRAERVLEGIWTRIVQSLMGQGSSIFLSRCKPTFFYSSTFHRIDMCLNMFPWFAWDTDRTERPSLSGLRIGTDKEPLLVHYIWNTLCFVFAATPYCIYRLAICSSSCAFNPLYIRIPSIFSKTLRKHYFCFSSLRVSSTFCSDRHTICADNSQSIKLYFWRQMTSYFFSSIFIYKVANLAMQ